MVRMGSPGSSRAADFSDGEMGLRRHARHGDGYVHATAFPGTGGTRGPDRASWLVSGYCMRPGKR